MAEWINELSSDIYDQLRDKARFFTVALDKSTEKTDNDQLAIFIKVINDQFEVTEELLSLCSMHSRATAEDIQYFNSCATRFSGLPWNRH